MLTLQIILKIISLGFYIYSMIRFEGAYKDRDSQEMQYHGIWMVTWAIFVLY